MVYGTGEEHMSIGDDKKAAYSVGHEPFERRSTNDGIRKFARRIGQQEIVFGLEIVLFVGFAVALPGFMKLDNLLSLVQNVAILGILSLGMGIVIIGQGMDLAMEMNMLICAAWAFVLAASGTPVLIALGLGLGLAVLFGIISGLLIAYVEIPALFTTLAMMSVVYGFGRMKLIESDTNFVPANAQGIVKMFGGSTIFSVPSSVVLFALLSILAFLMLRYTKFGRFIYAIGDNPLAARIAGIPVRPLTVSLYILTAFVAFVAGLVFAGVIGEVHTRGMISHLIYDVILVVAIGGIGLSGGTGGISNVVVGTLLIGTLLNGMTILNISYTQQNIVKGVILLVALAVDALVNPRDEQTSRQSDI
jgi:ribose transport system permease protein